jgi:hypothetical protein
MHMRAMLGGLVGAFLLVTVAASAQKGGVSCYCSLDAEYSKVILQEFEKRTGIHVDDTMDTEDNKTIGMVNRIISLRRLLEQ